tara:strand:+ start:319 stop:609 length:291 start_codon:yes stop_codon:yes gene_type:complete
MIPHLFVHKSFAVRRVFKNKMAAADNVKFKTSLSFLSFIGMSISGYQNDRKIILHLLVPILLHSDKNEKIMVSVRALGPNLFVVVLLARYSAFVKS